MAGQMFRGRTFVQPLLPARLGYECAGLVEAVRDGVDASWVGKRMAPMPGYDELLALGANHVIVTQDEDYETRIREITGGGVQLTYDPVAGPFLEQLPNATAPGGTITAYGVQSGHATPFPVDTVIGKGLTLRSYTMSEIARNPEAASTARQYILDRLTDGRFVPTVAKTFPLDQLQNAYQYLNTNQQVGRVVITMD